jgi:hypothetical protein
VTRVCGLGPSSRPAGRRRPERNSASPQPRPARLPRMDPSLSQLRRARDCKAKRPATAQARAKREPDQPHPTLAPADHDPRSRADPKQARRGRAPIAPQVTRVATRLGKARRRTRPLTPKQTRRGRAPIAPQVATVATRTTRSTEENKTLRPLREHEYARRRLAQENPGRRRVTAHFGDAEPDFVQQLA